MAHKLIVGGTETGKSTLARGMESDAVKRGILPVIYDPTLNPAWESEWVTSDEGEFLEMLRAAHTEKRAILAVIDEADTILSMSHRHNWWIFMRGRHFGIEAIAITQRPTNIAPSIRGNASELFAFRIPKSDALALADDFAAEGIAKAAELAQGEFLRAYWKDRKKIVDKYRVF